MELGMNPKNPLSRRKKFGTKTICAGEGEVRRAKKAKYIWDLLRI